MKIFCVVFFRACAVMFIVLFSLHYCRMGFFLLALSLTVLSLPFCNGNFYSLNVEDVDGGSLSLEKYQGKVIDDY